MFRSTGLTVSGFLLAQLEASVKLFPSQNVQVGVDGKQQRQQQRTSGESELVAVAWSTVVNPEDACSDVVVGCEIAKSVLDSY